MASTVAVETTTLPADAASTAATSLHKATTVDSIATHASARARPPPTVRVLTTADYKPAAACLAEAFADDPVCTYALDSADAAGRSAAHRWALHVRTFECAVYAHILGGVALGVPSPTDPARFDAVALWMPPGRNMDDWLTLLRSGLWRLRFALTPGGRQRFYNEFLPLLNATKAEVMGPRDADSWYLVYLGTRREARGRGLARRLIRYGTERADREGRATYLESSHRNNVPYYERLGFQVRKTVALKEGSRAEMDMMVREPGAAPV